LAAVLFSFVLRSSAHANGAFPDEFSVHFPAPSPQRIYVGANFGLIVSEDDGATWRYACEPWITEGSSAALSQANVSFYQLTQDGSILAESSQITRSEDDACTWPPSGGGISGQIVTDMFADANDATLVVAIVDVANGSYIVASHDGGKTFVDPPLYQSNALLTGVELAASTPGLMYATSISISGSAATLLTSVDSGQTWTSTSIATPAGTEPRIIGIDPVDSNTVYIRVVGAVTDSVFITTDGGQTFVTALSIEGQITSFLRAGDGALYAGTGGGELYIRAAGSQTFTSQPGPHFRCLGQRPGTSRIYACGDGTIDAFDLGYSDDNGATFVSLMNFSQILGPLTCPPVATNCVDHWARIQQVLGINQPTPDAGPPPAPDAGTSGPDAGPAPAGGGSSGCAAASSAPDSLALLFALLAWVHSRWRSELARGCPRR
jgi:photosystem II stability/assembly factor-like uncharacterized protein